MTDETTKDDDSNSVVIAASRFKAALEVARLKKEGKIDASKIHSREPKSLEDSAEDINSIVDKLILLVEPLTNHLIDVRKRLDSLEKSIARNFENLDSRLSKLEGDQK